jgi:hypothetical protein
MNPDVAEIKIMMMDAFSQAFMAQIGQLYKVYNQNAPSVEEQRAYTRRGIDNAIASYRIAVGAVNDWQG